MKVYFDIFCYIKNCVRVVVGIWCFSIDILLCVESVKSMSFSIIYSVEFIEFGVFVCVVGEFVIVRVVLVVDIFMVFFIIFWDNEKFFLVIFLVFEVRKFEIFVEEWLDY